MHDPGGVRCGEAVGHLHGEIQQRPSGALRFRPQWLAVDQFGGKEVHALSAAELVDGQDIRVVERAGGPGFRLETSKLAGGQSREEF